MIVGRVNPNQTLEDNGISNTAKVFYNLRRSRPNNGGDQT